MLPEAKIFLKGNFEFYFFYLFCFLNFREGLGPNYFDEFKKKLVSVVKQMQELKNAEKGLFAIIRKRELICSSIESILERFEEGLELSEVLKECTSSRIMLRNINAQI
jgi:hypothetical protein